jgi:hypothetical protein
VSQLRYDLLRPVDVKVAISTAAHSAAQLAHLRLGVVQAAARLARPGRRDQRAQGVSRSRSSSDARFARVLPGAPALSFVSNQEQRSARLRE